MDKAMTNKKIPSADSVSPLVISAYEGNPRSDGSFGENFYAGAYAGIAMRTLFKQKITPESLSMCARLFLMFEREPTSAVIFIGSNMKIKEIFPLTRCYFALFSEMSKLLIHHCKRTKSRRCAVIYNYPYKHNLVRRIGEADTLFKLCEENGILLADVIEFSGGRTESIMLPFRWNGIDQINKPNTP